MLSVIAELVFVQEWGELEDEFERCGGQKTKNLLTHGGRQPMDQDGGRQMDPALKDAGTKILKGAKNREREGGKDHEEQESEERCSVHVNRQKQG